jgi:hypothetical protein
MKAQIKRFAVLALALACFCMPVFSVVAIVEQVVLPTGSDISISSPIVASEATTSMGSESPGSAACAKDYNECMDQFCLLSDTEGKRCGCSADHKSLMAQLVGIEKRLRDASELGSVGVEKASLGAKADIIFNAVRKYDAEGNVMSVEAGAEAIKNAGKKKSAFQAAKEQRLQKQQQQDDDDVEVGMDTLAGRALFNRSHEMCSLKIPKSCNKNDIDMVNALYSTQIKNDCATLAKNIEDQKKDAEEAYAAAQKDVRDVLKDQYKEQNEYNTVGICTKHFKACMREPENCDMNWGRCVSRVAIARMQNDKIASGKDLKKKVEIENIDIDPAIQEMLDDKRMMCEHVLDKCMGVRNEVWPYFLRNIKDDINAAAKEYEKNKRMSCLTDITDCLHKACTANMRNTGESMDACLAYPEMVREMCKTEIEPCERMEKSIWIYTKDVLASMRESSCEKEVTGCLENFCGDGFGQCIGMDRNYLYNQCPREKMVQCKRTAGTEGESAKSKNAKGSDLFTITEEDYSRLLSRIFLQIDNSLLEQCENIIELKMKEICGETTDCNKFTSAEFLGTGSLAMQKSGDKYRLTGMISWGDLTIGDGSEICIKWEKKNKSNQNPKIFNPEECAETKVLPVGEIDVTGYLRELRNNPVNSQVPNKDAIVNSIEAELRNVQGKINDALHTLESDTKIQHCISGRDLSQITGKDEETKPRYPNLLNKQKMIIVQAALAQIEKNYYTKRDSEIARATDAVNMDVKQLICQRLAYTGGAPGTFSGVDTDVFPPFAISYEIGAGVSNSTLAGGGTGQSSSGGMNTSTVANAKGIFGETASLSHKAQGGGTNTERTAVFDRTTGICKVCTITTREDCKTKGSRGLFGLWDSRGMECNTQEPKSECKEYGMGTADANTRDKKE